MADNAELNIMAGGDVVAADDIGGVKFQRVKLVEGADGTNDGDISATNGLPVQLLAGTAAVGKLAANSGVDIGDVDVLSIAAGDNNIGNVDIDTLPALPAGTNSIGKLGANSGVDIGDVDVASITGLTMSNAGAQVTGDEAHDAADAGNPVKIGMKAYSPDGTTPGTAVAEGDRTDGKADLDGRLFVNTTHPRFGHKHLDGSSAYTDEALIADPGDGFQIIITCITVSTGAATAMNFFLEEGATKIFGPTYLEATAGRGVHLPGLHLPVTASTACTITTSQAIAQSIDVDYFIQAV